MGLKSSSVINYIAENVIGPEWNFYWTVEADMGWFFGQYIERLLQEKDWNRSRLASESGLTKPQINWIVAGKKKGTDRPPHMRPVTLQKLSKALGVPVADLEKALINIDPQTSQYQNKGDDWKSKYQQVVMENQAMSEEISNLKTELLLVGEERDRVRSQLARLISKVCPDEASKQALLREVEGK